MAKRTDLPKIPATDEPTIFNHGMSMGAFLGSFLTPVGTVVGGLIGGFWRKDQMEQNQLEGKTVSDPTFWNKGIFTGYWKGQVASLVCIGLAMATLGTAATTAFLTSLTLPVAATAGAAIGAGALAAAIVSPVAFAIIEGFREKAKMQEELTLAETIRDEQMEQAAMQELAVLEMLGRGMQKQRESDGARKDSHKQHHARKERDKEKEEYVSKPCGKLPPQPKSYRNTVTTEEWARAKSMMRGEEDRDAPGYKSFRERLEARGDQAIEEMIDVKA